MQITLKEQSVMDKNARHAGVCSHSEQFQAGYAGPGCHPGRPSIPAEARSIPGQAWKSKWALDLETLETTQSCLWSL